MIVTPVSPCKCSMACSFWELGAGPEEQREVLFTNRVGLRDGIAGGGVVAQDHVGPRDVEKRLGDVGMGRGQAPPANGQDFEQACQARRGLLQLRDQVQRSRVELVTLAVCLAEDRQRLIRHLSGFVALALREQREAEPDERAADHRVLRSPELSPDREGFAHRSLGLIEAADLLIGVAERAQRQAEIVTLGGLVTERLHRSLAVAHRRADLAT